MGCGSMLLVSVDVGIVLVGNWNEMMRIPTQIGVMFVWRVYVWVC